MDMPYGIKRLSAFLLSLLIALALLPITAAQAEESQKTVRVGWYESPFNTTDEHGRRSGYAYEYQRKIAAYTGWNYEYVNGSWPDLLQMLIDGEIDLMSDISYTEERAELMLYPSLPMGTEEYYIFVAPGYTGILPEDSASFNGKRFGVNKGSIQTDLFLEWAEQRGIEAELVQLTCSEAETIERLYNGDFDAYISLDYYGDPKMLTPVCKIGSSDFYFAVNKDRSDLLAELNQAMSRLQSENRYFNQQMFERYFTHSGSNAFLTSDESAWLSQHGAVRVGYQDNYLAFCAEDPDTGELTGALRDFLDYASGCLANAEIDFEAKAYPTAAAAIEALRRGEIDCMFPSNLSSYDGEGMDLVMTPSILRTDIYAVVRSSDQADFTRREHVIVAVNEGNPNYDVFLLDNFPNWRVVHYPSTQDCLKAVADGVADCVLISSYRYNNISRLCDKYNLIALSSGVALDYSFALRTGETELYSILAKTICLVPTSSVSASLSHYLTEDARFSLSDFVMDHLRLVSIVVGALLAVILALLLRSQRAERRARQIIAATETDEMTGLYNRDYFFEYANRMYSEHPEARMDAIVLNIEQFHAVNALNGRAFGDQVLRLLGRELREIVKTVGGIAGRFEADRFDLYCRSGEDYQALFERFQRKLDDLSPYVSIRLRMGVMPWQAGLDPVQLFDRARTACSMARGHFKEHLIVFDEKVRERELFNQRLLNDLRHALDTYQIEVYYQPKYDILSDPPKLVSAEALVRWNHPELGMIPPDEFIPLLESNGKIIEIDRYVWSEAARQVVRWRAEYGMTVPVSVNLSRVDVIDPDLESTLDGILRAHGLDRSALMLEVTESAYTGNAEQVIRVVESLRAKGYMVEMDDFGTGYSSLNMLSAMPIDVLKMDRAFVRNIEHSEKDRQLVALILAAAKNLNVPVVAEGVETVEQLRFLRELGCPVVQGYYFSRPLHPSEFENSVLQAR